MNRLEEIGNKYTILCSLKEKQNIDWDDDREIYIQKIEAELESLVSIQLMTERDKCNQLQIRYYGA